MERGLMWLPLLAIFIGLGWAGWNEYQKVEAYRHWAEDFDRAKYDIYAVLGQKGDRLTWGKPTRSGPVELQSFSLKDVKSIRLLVDRTEVDPIVASEAAPKGAICLEFSFSQGQDPQRIRFTEWSLASQWAQYLRTEWNRWHSEAVNSEEIS
ncbi:hypothetical protein [Oxynema aestuarii]|jgi:hypothetical protein|uniref:Uncharacterized protein n=1 Tax=Oxynema aestuarii AP17 TaxID=2064643 RepID=A0A6H1TY42_9CYAN|nr:hypothetical protein [Oxynema aestuarii]QIZ70683.1 hypothetical protein HCG48_08900 [Oxynema aestuarii AP17]RMH77018.1 MAG: hypothetical protein D6680_06625 [Cyanobacteria bacterium J007]